MMDGTNHAHAIRQSKASQAGPRRAVLVRLVAAALAVLAIAAGVAAAGHLQRIRTHQAIAARAANSLPLAASALRSEVERQRTLPLVLAGDGDVAAVLRAPLPAALQAIDARLEDLAKKTRAAVVYLVGRDGVTVAASNHREPTSFVGSDYGFRRYFTQAMANGHAEQYALGTVSRRPGLYISDRIDGADGPLGVIVAKIEMDAVEADWQRLGDAVYVTDDRGIVLLTSIPDWRFRAVGPIGAALATEIRDSLQFGEAALSPLPFSRQSDAGGIDLVSTDLGQGPRLFSALEAPISTLGWQLHLLVPTEPETGRAVDAAQGLTALVLVLLMTTGTFAWRRVRDNAARRRKQADETAELERRVAARTVDLSAANGRLRAEMIERQAAEARMARLRDDLAQANRLASLGQIAAGVAHEINQPVAAIRTYAENAALFLARDQTEPVTRNLRSVVALTDRIGAITQTLRTFSRRDPGEAGPVEMAGIIDGTLLILQGRLRESGLQMIAPEIDPELTVHGNRTRLEQVLVNLLQNAIEALEGQDDGAIEIAVEADAASVEIVVSDNGPGIPPDVMRTLFTPFNTSKPKGLGLGLVISSDIVTELGGRLTAESRLGQGTSFTVTLRRSR